MNPNEIDWEKFSGITGKHQGEKWGLIPLLQEIQESIGFIPPEAIESIAETLNLHPSQVQGVITFYSGFSTRWK